MDRRERLKDPEEALRCAIEGYAAGLWTSLPGVVVAFDPFAQTCTVQPTIKGQYRTPRGELQSVTMPVCVDCPVLFPGGGGFVLTFPIAEGDECLLFFASRCIDSWWQSSGVQPPAEFRMHDLSDGFVFVGPRSRPNVVPNISMNSTQLRSNDGSTYIELVNSTIINVVTPAALNISAPVVTIDGNLVQITGNVHVNQSIVADAEVTAGGEDGIHLSTHIHDGVEPGGGSTDGPRDPA